jgi:hypothetical protein
MKKLVLLLLLMTPLIMTNSLHAVTYPFAHSKPSNLSDQAPMMAGTRLYLFHSGRQELENAIRVDDVLIVYREYPYERESLETGKVKVLSLPDENYYEAEVIEGTIAPGELAKKGPVACFVTSLRKNGYQR